MMVLTSMAEFGRHVLSGEGFKVVRFCAEWSGPCHIMEPLYEEMSNIYSASATFYQVDIDKTPILKKEFGITELPTILLIQNGVINDFIIGLIARGNLIDKLENAMN